jgi:hypothetical protein
MNTLLTSGAFLLSILGTPVYANTSPVVPPLQPATLEQKIEEVSLKYEIASTTLTNLLMEESSLNPDIKDGDMDVTCVTTQKPVRARGLAQITECYHPEVSDAEAYDVDFALNWTAKEIANHTAWREHQVCNCYTYARTQIHNLPAMKDIQPNTPYPKVGGLLIQYFNKVKHIAVITKVSEEGIYVSQTNKTPCKFTKEIIPWNDKNREGYWSNAQ